MFSLVLFCIHVEQDTFSTFILTLMVVYIHSYVIDNTCLYMSSYVLDQNNRLKPGFEVRDVVGGRKL